MIIERIEAVSFGPLLNETIDLAPGMNVIFGPNEAAKSTLHSALYAALCGVRRARGRPRQEDEAFEHAHRPWTGDNWKVRARIRLADGRPIELEQDLANPGLSRVRDVATGRDVTSDIVNEGTPDASRWLGLTRRSFLSTACIRQAQLLAVVADPGSLQEELQRAAATAGRDETAAAAIALIKSFRSEHVGLDRANVRRPLKLARDAVRQRREALDQAQATHRRVLELLQEAEEAELDAQGHERAVRTVEAALAEQHARTSERTLARVVELAERQPAEPPALVHGAELGDRVAAALVRWESARIEPDLSGPASDELRAQLAALPPPPAGDTEIHESVRDARDRFAVARGRLEAHGSAPPEPLSNGVDADDDELRRLRDALAEEVPALDPALEERYASARVRHEHAGRGPSRVPIAIGAILFVAGMAMLLLGVLVGIVAMVMGAAVVAWAVASGRGGANRVAALEELRAAEAELGRERYEIESAVSRRARAETRCRELGIAPEAATIETLLAERAAAASAEERRSRWQKERDELARAVVEAEAELRRALAARGAADLGDVGSTFAAYEAACRGRAQQAAEAARRSELEAGLTARETKEKLAHERAEAVAELTELAGALTGPTTDPESGEEALRAWQAEREAELEAHQAALEEWGELQTLLDGRTIAELREEATRLRSRAERLVGDVDRQQLEDALGIADLDAEARPRRTALLEARQEAARKRADADGAARTAPSVPEAEEALAAAEQELHRVESLDLTLGTALEYLARAQERVHRDIAPVLAGTVAAWLPHVTAGRYAEVRVDPETLAVQVRPDGGEWRESSRLSHGTREQIYLLLRLALSEHLVVSDERTPLLFDAVTAHCDTSRREAILDLLHEISAERQVIVFSHEEPVREWAEPALDPPRDALFVREPVPVI